MEGGKLIVDYFLIAETFLKFENQLRRACKESGDCLTLSGLAKDCVSGKRELWKHEDSIYILDFFDQDLYYHCNICIACGVLEQTLEAFNIIETYAKTRNASFVHFGGRRGWGKFFKEDKQSISITRRIK